jgi:hypothetical protein
LNQLDLYDIQWGDHAIEGGLKAILSNPIASTIPKWWTLKTSEMDAGTCVSQYWNQAILYGDRSSKGENF